MSSSDFENGRGFGFDEEIEELLHPHPELADAETSIRLLLNETTWAKSPNGMQSRKNFDKISDSRKTLVKEYLGKSDQGFLVQLTEPGDEEGEERITEYEWWSSILPIRMAQRVQRPSHINPEAIEIISYQGSWVKEADDLEDLYSLLHEIAVARGAKPEPEDTTDDDFWKIIESDEEAEERLLGASYDERVIQIMSIVAADTEEYMELGNYLFIAEVLRDEYMLDEVAISEVLHKVLDRIKAGAVSGQA